MSTQEPQVWVGRALPRFEDERLLRGQATYIEDMARQRMAHICFVRSPYAHARISDIDLSAPPAVANAVLDALRPEGVLDLELPMTPDRIWHALLGQRRD